MQKGKIKKIITGASLVVLAGGSGFVGGYISNIKPSQPEITQVKYIDNLSSDAYKILKDNLVNKISNKQKLNQDEFRVMLQIYNREIKTNKGVKFNQVNKTNKPIKKLNNFIRQIKK